MKLYNSLDLHVPQILWLSGYILNYWDVHISKVLGSENRQILLDGLRDISRDQWACLSTLKFSRRSTFVGYNQFDGQILHTINWLHVNPPILFYFYRTNFST
jgi:hypothetical protein